MTDSYERQQAQRPAQQQPRQPGREGQMSPPPIIIREGYRGSGRLAGKRALITGGDSGIGRAIAVHFARESADVAIAYLEEDEDARHTRELVAAEGRRCALISGDLGEPAVAERAVAQAVEALGGLDVLVNHAGEQHPVDRPEALTAAQIERTFRTNVFAIFYVTLAALPHLGAGASIINTTSVTAYRGSGHLIDYAASNGAITAMIRSLAKSLAERGVRVNGVAPGPIWTPLIPASFPAEHVAQFGSDTPLGRAGQPAEVAPAYVLLASEDASYFTGQVLHPNGGDFIST